MGECERRLAALATLGELAATVVHEIKGPLAVAHGYIQLLQGRVEAPKEREMCERVRQQLERIDQLVQGLLFLAHPQRSSFRPCRPDEIIRNTVSLLEATARARGVEIRIQGLNQLPVINADPTQISHLLLNLLLNSMEAMPQSGLIRIRLRPTRDRTALILAVGDNGHGIPIHIRDRVFEPFVTTKETGTGLGLAICRRIVQEHGGDIRIQCRSWGTVVKVLIPVDPCAGNLMGPPNVNRWRPVQDTPPRREPFSCSNQDTYPPPL